MSTSEVPAAPIPRRRLRLGGPRWLRGLLLVGLGIGLWAAFRAQPLFGLILLAAVVGFAVEVPDPEATERQRAAALQATTGGRRRLARAHTPLTPVGTVAEGERLIPARSLEGHLPAGAALEVVNEIDGVLMVQRAGLDATTTSG